MVISSIFTGNNQTDKRINDFSENFHTEIVSALWFVSALTVVSAQKQRFTRSPYFNSLRRGRSGIRCKAKISEIPKQGVICISKKQRKQSRKKNHYKISHTRKLRDKSCKFFAKYENNVTRTAFIYNYRKFIEFCRTYYDSKTKNDCREHIEDYLNYLKSKDLKPDTIRTYMSPVVLYHGLSLSDFDMPKRCPAKNTRSRGERKEYRPNADPTNPKYALSVGFQEKVGIRRAELTKLCKDDFVIDESGYPCVRVKRGKGGKFQLQRILPDDVEFIKAYFDGTPDRVFSESEMKNKIDYHRMRAIQAFKAYNYYLNRLNTEPDYRETLEKEILKRWNKYNLNEKGKPKRFDRKDIIGTYKIEDENKKLAIEKGLPLEYDRLAVKAVSIFHLAHWRLDVSIVNYLLAVNPPKPEDTGAV